MGETKKPERVKLVIGMLSNDIKLFKHAERQLIKKFGCIQYKSALIEFHYTDYYKEELGCPVKRKFISFKKLVSPCAIAKIKKHTNLIEKKFSVKQGSLLKRRINIDPGYITAAKFILATTKDFFHRIYLERGIYAEVTLFWKKGSFHAFDWTYPDYRTKEYIEILDLIRNSYMKESRV